MTTTLCSVILEPIGGLGTQAIAMLVLNVEGLSCVLTASYTISVFQYLAPWLLFGESSLTTLGYTTTNVNDSISLPISWPSRLGPGRRPASPTAGIPKKRSWYDPSSSVLGTGVCVSSSS